MSNHNPGWIGLIKLRAPPEYELKQLTDEELKHTIACYCDKCGTQLRMHILFPIVGGLALEHACVARPPVMFEYTMIEVKPMDMPVSALLLDYKYEGD